ncbi:MAG: PadR family transcriptional regulator [Anaerolineae bacterium]|nr:PadR family transcriptional regulator [Anaerolineae bacterium]
MATGKSFGHLVLGLLDQQPMSGYDIKRLIERLSWLIGGASFGNIYPTLHTLLKDKLVTVDVESHQDKPLRKVYSINERGRQALQAWLKQPIPRNASPKAFVMRLILTRDLAEDTLAAHLQDWHAQILSHLDDLREMNGRSEQPGVGWHLALDYGLAVANTELIWLDRVSQSLREPLPELVNEGARVIDAG